MSTPPLSVMLRVAGQARAGALAATLAARGHVVIQDPAQRADVVLADQAPADALSPVPVLVLSDAPDADPAAAGLLRADPPPALLEAALCAVAAGLRVREPRPPKAAGFAAAEDEGGHVLLTPREMDILSAIGDGLSNKAVARRLGISAHTVKFHLEAIFAKLDATSRAEAVAKGLRQGLIEL